MMVMPANARGGVVHYWAGRYPGAIGHLYSPDDGSRVIPYFPFALDNGAYPAFMHGTEWSADRFRAHVAKYERDSPLWVLAPDVVGDREATLRLWDAWYAELQGRGFPIAFAVQDGMTAADVPQEAAVVFVGGSTTWKRRTLYEWPRRFPRVHVGRINTEKWLWRCHEAGVESCDGTGWFRGNQVQRRGLERFLERQDAGAVRSLYANHELFEAA